MNDLIRREDVIKLVNQFVFGLCKAQNDEVIKIFNKYVEKIPTAYDVDNVVRQLKTDSSVKLYGSGNSNNYLIPLEKAIEIVKAGGMNNNSKISD